MRNYDGILELRPTLIGTIAVGATAVGASVDTLGFKDVLATLVLGAVTGTAGNTGQLNVKIQESASATGTGANWTDITDGDYSGTFAFSELTFDVGTDANLGKDIIYERLGADRQRYIRAHATMTGTGGAAPKYSVQFLLGRPDDTLYIADASTQATGNVEYTIGK